MLSPAAGLDPHLSLDVRPLAARLLLRLQADSRYHALSAKFAIQLDGGEDLAMLEHPHDIRPRRCPRRRPRRWSSDSPAARPATAPGGVAGGAGRVPGAGVARPVPKRAQPQQTRMRHLLQELDGEPLLEALAGAPGFPLRRDERVAAWRRSPGRPWSHLGVQPQRQPGLVMVGAAAPLGRLDSACLEGLAELVERHGDGSLRLTLARRAPCRTWRRPRPTRRCSACADLGLLTEPDAPLARLIACSGSSACARGRPTPRATPCAWPNASARAATCRNCTRAAANGPAPPPTARRSPCRRAAAGSTTCTGTTHVTRIRPVAGQPLDFATAADYLAALPSQPTSGKPA
ncbi:precorrin-3B synthase [Pseudomonas aeruginosa]|nr:precorrin-3B synthase [Pseudomonas aeruginosa]